MRYKAEKNQVYYLKHVESNKNTFTIVRPSEKIVVTNKVKDDA